ncbi:hypothetical protein [Candidatus Poriferisodalis sp.]
MKDRTRDERRVVERAPRLAQGDGRSLRFPGAPQDLFSQALVDKSREPT